MIRELIKKKAKEKAKKQSDMKWMCWTAASFAKCASWFEEAKLKPGRYKEGAEKDFAGMAMAYLLDLHELDKDGCRMVVDSWHSVINEMIDELGSEQKYYKVFV